ncbi:molybdate ABC transporter permease subunit [Anoxynatronum buryatiense]|uniref:Molybdenum transport system permease n=1 Tax=Anoxynatronum buryatiense TaxID=489973 RepID=A0AA46AIL5_9CLOT|nr:molybdate ABC transporter permease subunit [Anoxynatronum buryatiense]SMP51866.1 molybdate transport system permease protein [Anoxynatronum buryatiense]
MQLSPILISLKTASVAIFFTFLLGLFAAQWVVKIQSKKVKMIMDGILTLPLVLPPTVVGFFLLFVFGVNRPLGRFLLHYLGVRIIFSWPATVIAAVVVSFPLMYRSARGAFEQVDQNLIMAARTLRLSERQVFWRILMPQALPGVVGGGILAFARGLGEFGATAMIAGNIENRTRTLPMAIYSEVAAGNMDTAGYYVIIVLTISFLVVVLTNYVSIKEGNHEK